MPDSDALLMQKEEATKPALSATSDKPAFIQKDVKEDNRVEVKEPVAKTEVTPVDSESAAAKAKTTEDSATSDETPPGDDAAANTGDSTPRGVQKKIDKERRLRGDAERLAEEQSKRLEQALELIERQNGKAKPDTRTESAQDDPRPIRDQFDNPDDYDTEIALWGGRQAVKRYQSEQAESAQKAKINEEFDKVAKSWDSARKKALDKYHDYVEVAESDELPIPTNVGFSIAQTDNGTDILYWLGKNIEEAQRIAELPFRKADQEIGRLSERLAKEKPGVSKAPSPVKPIGSRSNAGSVTPEEDPGYMERRLTEMRSKKH